MRNISHKNVLQLYEIYETENHYHLIIEHCSIGDLGEYINKNLNSEQILNIFYGVSKGVQYLNSQNIIHRDLKPANILLRSVDFREEDVVLIDFGFATYLNADDYVFENCGTPNYAAPEIFGKDNSLKEKINFKVDVFSLGKCFYKFLFKKHVHEINLEYINEKKCNEIFRSLPIYKPYSDEVMDLLERMLMCDINKRISIDEILSHKLFKTRNLFKLIYIDKKKIIDLDNEFYQINEKMLQTASGSL